MTIYDMIAGGLGTFAVGLIAGWTMGGRAYFRAHARWLRAWEESPRADMTKPVKAVREWGA